MRNWLLAGAVAFGPLLAAGCGSKTVVNDAPLTDEEKRKIAENDKQVESEESPGNKTLKAKPGKK